MGYSLTIITNEQYLNPSGNQSSIYVVGRVSTDQYTSHYGYASYWTVRIGGQNFFGTGPANMGTSSSWDFGATATFDHDSNGWRGNVTTRIEVGITNRFSGAVDGVTHTPIDYDRSPAAPTTVTPALNLDKSITVTSNAVSSPAGTATYYVGYRASSDLGATWGGWSSYTTIPANARTYTYAAGTLTYGLTYQFRMYASNSDGSSAATSTTVNTFLPAGGKRFDGSAWNPTSIAKRFDGTNWNTLTIAKRHNGTGWVDLS